MKEVKGYKANSQRPGWSALKLAGTPLCPSSSPVSHLKLLSASTSKYMFSLTLAFIWNCYLCRQSHHHFLLGSAINATFFPPVYMKTCFKYRELHIFKVYNWIGWDISIQLWNHHLNQDDEHVHCPPKFSHALWNHLCFVSILRQRGLLHDTESLRFLYIKSYLICSSFFWLLSLCVIILKFLICCLQIFNYMDILNLPLHSLLGGIWLFLSFGYYDSIYHQHLYTLFTWIHGFSSLC